MDTVATTINLPMNGSRHDYLHCVSSALMTAQACGDTVSAMALIGLMQLVSEALERSSHHAPHYFIAGPSYGGQHGTQNTRPHNQIPRRKSPRG
jgi:hypothetical protein